MRISEMPARIPMHFNKQAPINAQAH
jgi:hypothetical protein